MAKLSGRQAEILEFISRHTRDRGYPPTVREIGQAVGLASPSTVHAHLAKLADLGLIRRDATKPRAMLVNEARDRGERPSRALPLVGAVAAGMPRLAEEHVEDWVDTPFTADFLLRISGDSMRDAGILDGDLVAVARTPTADAGEIVIALVEDEATCKRLRFRDGRVVLQPENPDYPEIVPDEVALLGRVVGVLRTL
ncbi:MAG TPA: transcriptional repressor LexA [Miltoncostaeaceae bacterium]|jgi:repressor LexA|nr:transcriptional repressor LexA [Miltoncostaeaceae bacterium]